jgi:hypothetical protein
MWLRFHGLLVYNSSTRPSVPRLTRSYRCTSNHSLYNYPPITREKFSHQNAYFAGEGKCKHFILDFPKSAVRGSWKRRTFVTRKRAKLPVHFCSGDVSECSLLFCTNDAFDMVNAHYVIIDFRAKFFIKIQNQASDTSRSLPSFSSAPFLLRAVPSERLGQV